MTTITCKVSEKLAAQLEVLARTERRSKSDLVREALEERLKSNRRRGRATAFHLVKHLCGSIKDGPRDIATNPKYMDGFGE
jgi:Arc/MetJ-type ribon-helix-helix transcriptional regulator